ncbi:MAG: flagellar basal body-associated FliL family protein [Succinivibrio sp.]
MADNKEDNELDQPKGKGKLLLLVAVILLLLLGTGGYFGAAYFMNLPPFGPVGPTPEEIASKKAEEEKAAKLLQREIYVKCSQTFTYTIKSERRIHTGQIDVVLVVQGEENEALATKHLTLIESVIFDRLSAQTYEGLLLPSGRQMLKRTLLDATRAKMTEVAKAPVIDRILFTNFVLQ